MSDDAGWLLLWFPAVFAGIWIGVSLLLSWIGGWRELARHYRADRSCTGAQFRMQSAGMRWGTAYRSSVNLGADASGLFLSVFPLFRAGHPPLFIPWSDISFSKERRWLVDSVRLRFRAAPGVSLLIFTKLATRVFANGPLRLDAAGPGVKAAPGGGWR
jgi:hypothetical protein